MDWRRMDLKNGSEQKRFKEWIEAEWMQRIDRSRMDLNNGSEQNIFKEWIGAEWIQRMDRSRMDPTIAINPYLRVSDLLPISV